MKKVSEDKSKYISDPIQQYYDQIDKFFEQEYFRNIPLRNFCIINHSKDSNENEDENGKNTFYSYSTQKDEEQEKKKRISARIVL